MLTNFKAISLSHRNAPVEVRELMSLDETLCKEVLTRLKDFTDLSEAIILSTCNRTEVYYSSNNDWTEEIIKLIGITKGIENISSYKSYFQSINEHNDAIAHL